MIERGDTGILDYYRRSSRTSGKDATLPLPLKGEVCFAHEGRMNQTGTATPISPGLLARARDGLRYIIGGVTPSTWFGPFSAAGAASAARGRGTAVRLSGRLQSQHQAARRRADLVPPIARAGRQLRSGPHRDRDPQGPARTPRLEHPPPRPAGWRAGPERNRSAHRRDRGIFSHARPEHFWSSWLRQLLEDLFVIDAPALYPRRTRGGQLFALEAIDGATVKRLLNADGRTPAPPDPAYQQVLHGLPAADLTTRDLIYRPRNIRAHKSTAIRRSSRS